MSYGKGALLVDDWFPIEMGSGYCWIWRLTIVTPIASSPFHLFSLPWLCCTYFGILAILFMQINLCLSLSFSLSLTSRHSKLWLTLLCLFKFSTIIWTDFYKFAKLFYFQMVLFQFLTTIILFSTFFSFWYLRWGEIYIWPC